MKNYDAIIIGGGAGLKIARPAGDLGYKIAVVEEDKMGGTCLNKGCIPSKMLIHPADVVQLVKDNEPYDLRVDGEIKIDAEKLVKYVSETVDNESNSIYPLYEKHTNIDLYRTHATFESPNTLRVNDELIEGKKIFIAAGGRPYIPSIKGIEEVPYLTSTEVLRLQNLPESMIILGSGYIATELGHYLDAMGVQLQFAIRSSFMKNLDDDLQKHFAQCFSKRFQINQMSPQTVSYENNKIILSDGKISLTADSLLLATGLTPNTDKLSLDKAGVALNDRGFISVNDHLQTNQPHIYAFGDIIGRCMFRHSANFEGEYLLNEHFENPNSNTAIAYPPVPYGVFTWPQIGGVGKSERELKEEKRDYVVGFNPYRNSAMGMALRKDEGFVKLLFDAKTKTLLGGHVIGEQATTMVHTIIAFINMKAILDDLLKTIYIHPALPEVIRNAARIAKKEFDRRSSDA